MRPLVILRPQPGASATAETARDMGLQPVVIPLFRIEPIPWTAPDPARFDALLVTSANAIRCGGPELERLRGLPACCVGKATAAAADEAGFDVLSAGQSGAGALLAPLPLDLRLLHLCGVDRHQPAEAGQAITTIDVYRAAELAPPPELSAIEGAVAALHSPRAAARLGRLANDLQLDRSSIALVAISERAAAAAGSGWERIEVASEPADAALLAIASKLCNKPA